MKRICTIILSIVLLVEFITPTYSHSISNIGSRILAVYDNNFELDSQKSEAVFDRETIENCRIDIDILYEWDHIYAAIVTIENVGFMNIEDWILEFEFNGRITKVENAILSENSDISYYLTPKPYTKIIAPKETIQIGLIIEGEPVFCNLIAPTLYGVQTKSYLNEEISINDDALVYWCDNAYAVFDVIDSFSVNFNNIDGLINYEYKIVDEQNNTLSSSEGMGKEIRINLGGLFPGYNHVIIKAELNGSVLLASFDLINFNPQNSIRAGLDMKTDTDDDGICDYLEYALEMDPNDPESIYKGKKDFESILEIIGINDNSEQVSTSTSYDMPVDSAPAEPSHNIASSISYMVVHRTAHPEGTKESLTSYNYYVSDDLTFNDYSYDDLCAISTVFGLASITPESLMWSEMALLFSAAHQNGSSMNDVLDDMIYSFRYGNSLNVGTTVEEGDLYSSIKYITFSDSILTNTVKTDSNTLYYTNLIKNYVVNFIKFGGNAYNLYYTIGGSNNIIENYVYGFYPSPYPKYEPEDDRALAIAIHMWHGHTVSLCNYNETSSGFSGTLRFHFYDHFGLDLDDEISYAGFCDWFALQHYTRFNGSYCPFLTYCDFYVNFSGSF